jgi:hypothetical protein
MWLLLVNIEDFAMLIASGYPPAAPIASSIFFLLSTYLYPLRNACLLSSFKLNSSIAYLNVYGTVSCCFVVGPMEYAISLLQSYWLNPSWQP